MNNLEFQIYELVARHFLACVSGDARATQTNVEFKVKAEMFEMKGLAIQERNYLDVYKYESWGGNSIP
jgi:DNA topoisomerase-3